MRIQVVTERAAAEALRPEWNALLDGAPDASVFLTPEWLLSWWDAFGGGLGMYLVAVRDGGRLASLVPLAESGGSLGGWSNEYTDRSGPVVAADAREALEAAVRHLAADAPPWSRLVLGPLSTASRVTSWVADAMTAVGAGVGEIPWFRSPIVDLPDDPAALRARLGPSFSATLRRVERKAAAAGLEAEVRTDSGCLDEVFEVARDSWAHAAGTGIGSTGPTRSFYTALADEAARRGWLRIALLRDAGGRPVAYELNLVRSGEGFNIKLGYRTEDAGMSPGLVLRAAVCEALIAEGVATFDLLGADEPYKLHWAGRTVSHVRLRVFPPTVVGRFRHAYRNGLRPAVASMVRRGGRRG